MGRVCPSGKCNVGPLHRTSRPGANIGLLAGLASQYTREIVLSARTLHSLGAQPQFPRSADRLQIVNGLLHETPVQTLVPVPVLKPVKKFQQEEDALPMIPRILLRTKATIWGDVSPAMVEVCAYHMFFGAQIESLGTLTRRSVRLMRLPSSAAEPLRSVEVPG